MTEKFNEKKFQAELERLRSGLMVDKHSLDDELMRQPQRFEEVGEAMAMAQAERDYAKEELIQLDAELFAKHRRKIEKSGVRATEALIAAAVNQDPKHQKGISNRIEAQRRLELLSAIKESFNQRSYMIRDLCSLFTASYFERTAVTASSPVKDVKAEKARDKMSEARRARKREK